MTRAKFSRIVDWTEILGLTALLALQVWRVTPSLAQNPWNLTVLILDAMPLGFLFMRRPAVEVSRSPADWLSAFTATAAPLLLAPGGEQTIPSLLGGAMMVLGLAVSLCAKAWLWRSFGLVAANRGVRRTGPYAVVRHPLYLSYVITQVAFLAMNATPANAALVAAGFGMQLIRLRAEERVLSGDAAYRAYMRAVPYRLAPGLF